MICTILATLLVAAHARNEPSPPSDRANLRANLCFSSFEKTELYCREAPAPGPLDVYESPSNGFRTGQLARKMYWRRGGKLCDEKRRACRKMPVRVLAANADLPKPAAFGFSALCLLLPAVVLYFGSRRMPVTTAAPKPPAAAKDGGGMGVGARIATGLLRFASQPWFPWVAAAGTAINLFTIVFTAATVVLFLGAVLGQRKRWRSTAIANALGATAGSAVLLLLMRMQGDGAGLLERQFPTVLASPAWAKTTALMQSYGVVGMVVVSSLPLILHPVIAFGVLTGMSDGTILSIVLLGRSVKYLVMGYLTAHAPAALRFFGIKASLVDLATKATAEAEK